MTSLALLPLLLRHLRRRCCPGRLHRHHWSCRHRLRRHHWSRRHRLRHYCPLIK